MNSLPITEPFPGESGIPQDTARKKGGKGKIKAFSHIVLFYVCLILSQQ